MPTFTAHAPGTPSWVDIMSPDVEASSAFYRAVFGWDAEPQFDPDGNHIYTMFRQGGKAVAGMGGQPPMMAGAPAIWNTYITTADVDATATAVADAGGSVMMPAMDVMESGRMAVFADPTGAAFSVWQPGQHVGIEVGNVHNTMSWNELMTRDVDSALGFYTKVFGWQYMSQDMGEMGVYNVIAGGTNDEGAGGVMAMPAEMPDQVPNHWMVYFQSDDVAATCAAVTAAGGTVVSGPFAIPGIGQSAVVHDPAGATFSLMQPEG